WERNDLKKVRQLRLFFRSRRQAPETSGAKGSPTKNFLRRRDYGHRRYLRHDGRAGLIRIQVNYLAGLRGFKPHLPRQRINPARIAQGSSFQFERAVYFHEAIAIRAGLM